MRELFRWAFEHSDLERPAVIEPATGTRRTYRELRDRTGRLARGLQNLGLRRGDRAVILLRNCAEFLEIDIALATLGVVKVPVMYASTDADLEHYVRETGAIALFHQSEASERVAALRDAGRLPIESFICVDGGSAAVQSRYERLIVDAAGAVELEPLDGEDLCSIRFSAGTTGTGKGVMHTHAGWASMVTLLTRNVNLGQYIRPGHEVALNAHPMSHGAGMEIERYFICGCTNVILDGVDPALFCRTVEQEKVTATWLVPSGLNKIISAPEFSRYDMSSLQTVFYGASPMPEGVLRRALKLLGPVFVQDYGSSEAPEVCTVLHKHEHNLDTLQARQRIRSAGRAVLGVEIRIVDDEGTVLGSGEIGEICMRTPSLMKGYLNRENLTRERLVDGWIRQGDIGYLDDEGYLFILDRKEDMIITGGFNVYPAEVESVLSTHPAVREVAVVGVPHERWGESIKAVVVPSAEGEVTLQMLEEHCKGTLPSYMKPTSLDVVTEIPLNPAGKPMRRVLREPYWRKLSRAIN